MKEKHKSRRKKKQRVILDTNVIFTGIGLRNRDSKRAINKAKKRDHHIYTEQVDKELSGYRGDKVTEKRIGYFRKENRKKIVRVEPATNDLLKEYPAKGKDRIILHEAKQTGTNVIVTQDKKFVKKANGFNRIKVISPQQYLKRNKFKKKNKD